MQVEVIPSLGEKLLEAPCKISIQPSPPSEGMAEIWTQGLVLKPSGGRTLFLPFTEISKIEPANYVINIVAARETPSLLGLGSNYDHFSLRLTDSWGDALAQALLMHESTVEFETRASYSEAGSQPVNSRIRLHPTSLVILPVNSLPRKIPLSYIRSAGLEGYKLRVDTLTGVHEFSKMGNQTQFMSQKLTATQRALEASSIETIRSMLPAIGYDELRRLSMMMLEGRAAVRKDVETISADLWPRIERNVSESPLAESYAHLSSLDENKYRAIGLRKTEDGVYVWFLILIRGSINDGGNTLVMEVTSQTGHATYLFRVLSRQDFPNYSPEQFAREGENLIRELNEAMIATGFRREPIYLSEDQLNTTAYAKYLYATKNLEPLRFLRERFFARIIHHTYDQWKRDLADALLFNTKTNNDQARWDKSELDLFETESTSWAAPGTGAIGVPTISTSSTTVEKVSLTDIDSQRLNLKQESPPNVTQPILANTTERVLTLSRMEGTEDGRVRLWLRDNEMDHDTAVLLKSDDASKLGAFPGSKVKLSLQRV